MTSDPKLSSTLRRVVTEHDAGGRSVVARDETCDWVDIPSGDARFALVWTTAQVPADNIGDLEGASRDAGLTLKGGSVLRIVDFRPGARSPMHRSHSIDYGLVLQGQVDMQLDGGEVTHLKPGDIVVQRGTNHLWINPSENQWARMAFILIEAKPVLIQGNSLDDDLL